MNKTLNKLVIAAAACLALGSGAQAGSMGYPERYSVREYETGPTYAERRVVRQQPTYMTDREEGFGERIVRFPGRAARTVVRSPIIVGETVAGRREVISDRGFFDGRSRERVVYRDTDNLGNRRYTTRRLSSRRLERTGDNLEYVGRRTGDTLERGAVSTGRGIVRTGRTVARTPVIIGETLTGQREVISDEGRPFARNR